MPSHYLNQSRFIANWTIRNKLQWNLNQNTKIFIHKNASENIVCEMAAISQTIFSDTFLWMKIFVFWFKFLEISRGYELNHTQRATTKHQTSFRCVVRWYWLCAGWWLGFPGSRRPAVTTSHLCVVTRSVWLTLIRSSAILCKYRKKVMAWNTF